MSRPRNIAAGGAPPVLTLRSIFLAFCLALLMLGVVLSLDLRHASQRPATPFLALVAIVGLASLAGVLWARARPLGSDNPTLLLQSFTTNFFIGPAFADLPALMGFIGALNTGRIWPYLAGGAVSVVGFALTAPTDGAIRRRDEQLMASGSPYLLSNMLRPPSAPAS